MAELTERLTDFGPWFPNCEFCVTPPTRPLTAPRKEKTATWTTDRQPLEIGPIPFEWEGDGLCCYVCGKELLNGEQFFYKGGTPRQHTYRRHVTCKRLPEKPKAKEPVATGENRHAKNGRVLKKSGGL